MYVYLIEIFCVKRSDMTLIYNITDTNFVQDIILFLQKF